MIESPNPNLNKSMSIQSNAPYPLCRGHSSVKFYPQNKVCLNPFCKWKCLICQKCSQTHIYDGHEVQEMNFFKHVTLKKLSMNGAMGADSEVDKLISVRRQVLQKYQQLQKQVGGSLKRLRKAINNQFMINIQTFYDETYQRQLRSLNNGLTNEKIAAISYKIQVLKRNEQQKKYVISSFQGQKYLKTIKVAQRKFKQIIQDFKELQYYKDLQNFQINVLPFDIEEEKRKNIQEKNKIMEIKNMDKIDNSKKAEQLKPQNKTQINQNHFQRKQIIKQQNKSVKNNKNPEKQMIDQKEKLKQKGIQKLKKEKKKQPEKDVKKDVIIIQSNSQQRSPQSNSSNERSRDKKHVSKGSKKQMNSINKESEKIIKTPKIQTLFSHTQKQTKRKQKQANQLVKSVNITLNSIQQKKQESKQQKPKLQKTQSLPQNTSQIQHQMTPQSIAPAPVLFQVVDDECIIIDGVKRPRKIPSKMTEQQLQAWFQKYYLTNQIYSLVLSHRSKDGIRQFYLYCVRQFNWYTQDQMTNPQFDQIDRRNSYVLAWQNYYKKKKQIDP